MGTRPAICGAGRGGGLLRALCLLLGCTPDVELLRPARDAATADTTPAPDVVTSHWTIIPSNTARDLHDVWGAAGNDAWAVGDMGTVLHFDGTSWQPVPTDASTTWTGVWTSRARDVWIVGTTSAGDPAVLRGDGTRWTPSGPQFRGHGTVRAVWGAAPNDVWLVGGASDSPEPATWHWDGAMWRPEMMPGSRPPTLTAVAGGGANDVWAVSDGPVIFHRADGVWSASLMPPAAGAFGAGLCATAAGTVWVTTTTGAVLRGRDTLWTPTMPDASSSLRGLWCARDDDVWAVGDASRALHWGGASWVARTAPAGDFAAVWGTPSGTVWAVGSAGVIARYDP